MPNLNEFFNKKNEEEIVIKNARIETIDGSRPCKDCDLDSDVYYFNQETLEMFWTCPSGHKNLFKVG